MDKAKTIAHTMRRLQRDEEFAPFDQVIMKQIPGTDVQQVEEERQKIRDKYAAIQTQIDNAVSVDDLEAALKAAK
jgi:copper oxidase (laccase) domain-containing protein